MTLDLIVLGAIALFAVWGAFSGFARQVAQSIALVGAGFAALPGGHFFAGAVSKALQTSLTVGVVVATVASFVVVFLVGRLLLTLALRRLLSPRDPENRSADRLLGFLLGAVKTTATLWVALSAATFVENNLVLAGKKYSFTPKDSKAVAIARGYNFIESFQFAHAKDLALAARVAADPKAASKLKDDPSYAALVKDPRFRALTQGSAWKKALETGDVRGLLQSNGAVELLQDPKLAPHLERLASQAD